MNSVLSFGVSLVLNLLFSVLYYVGVLFLSFWVIVFLNGYQSASQVEGFLVGYTLVVNFVNFAANVGISFMILSFTDLDWKLKLIAGVVLGIVTTIVPLIMMLSFIYG